MGNLQSSVGYFEKIGDMMDMFTNKLTDQIIDTVMNGKMKMNNKSIELLVQFEKNMRLTYGITDLDDSLVGGVKYEFGIGTEKNIPKAIECYKSVLANGDKKVACLLGRLYSLDGEYHNDEEAIKYYKIAAEVGELHALFYMAYHNINIGNIDEAIKYYKILVENESDDAMYELACIYNCNDFGRKNMPEAIKYYEMAAKENNIDAMIKLSEIYIMEPTYKNIPMAVKYNEDVLKIDSENSFALENLAYIFSHCEKYYNISMANDYLARASKNKDATIRKNFYYQQVNKKNNH